MRRLYTLIILASLSIASAIAQTGTGFVGNNYYRVRNYGTQRYIYVTDNTDVSDWARENEDLQAIQLWKGEERTIYDPATVIYIIQYSDGTHYNLKAQGTGVAELTGHAANVTKQRDGTYVVSATKDSFTKNLYDEEPEPDEEEGLLGTQPTETNYMKWVIDKIETNKATNYFGIKPNIEVNGKYYKSFYAGFPFKTASPNMHVYYVSKVAGNVAYMKEIVDVVPPATPVIIECSSTDPSNNRLELIASTNATVTGNKLSGVYFCNGYRLKESVDAYKKFDAAAMRLFTVANGKLILSNDAPDQIIEIQITDWNTYRKVKAQCLFANTSYLPADSGTPDVLEINFNGDGIDEILAENKDTEAEGVYTLSGTKLREKNDVQGLPAGLYIVGGVKFVIR